MITGVGVSSPNSLGLPLLLGSGFVPLLDKSAGELTEPFGFVAPAVAWLLKSVCVAPFNEIRTVNVTVWLAPMGKVLEVDNKRFWVPLPSKAEFTANVPVAAMPGRTEKVMGLGKVVFHESFPSKWESITPKGFDQNCGNSPVVNIEFGMLLTIYPI